ncbi:hypothetical protein PRIC2_004051 [Phytophthora ramorum]|uniref:uncharacterized protein n=1 Tax=Phytophthora ramorum TaxID=164328 RepID=UPI003097DB18|nr:hypothetical protein KRP23_3988 [Phytophthora ramorum]
MSTRKIRGPDGVELKPPRSGVPRAGWTAEADTSRLRRHVSEVTRVSSFHNNGSAPKTRRSLLATQDSRREIIRRGSVQELTRSGVEAAGLAFDPDKSRSCVLQ